jgi:hypothetical protein
MDAFFGTATERWQELGGRPRDLEMAVERREIDLGRTRASATGAAAPV